MTAMNSSGAHILDNAVWAALSGPQSVIAQVNGLARRYPADVSPFGAIADHQVGQAWIDLAELIGPGGTIVLTGSELQVPHGWKIINGGEGFQMLGDEVLGLSDDDAVPLGIADVPEMLDLVARTEPGPFLPGTWELGGYLGIRIDGVLAAMAGCRFHAPGWREISAVCTDSAYQGRGLAGRLVRAIVANIKAEGDYPFLHVSKTNENAIRLYEALGFKTRSIGGFALIQAP